MADQIVEMLKARKGALEAELKQVTNALNQFTPAVKTGTAVTVKPARKPMSEEAKKNMRDAQLRRHQHQVAESKLAPKGETPSSAALGEKV